jgi:pimeloyl-ACP methyl ester carboxylesterase
MGQDNLDEFGLALEGEQALRPYLEQHQVALQGARAADIVVQLQSLLPPADLAVLNGELGEDIAASMREAVAQLDGWIDDDLAFTRDWGFDLSSIEVPTFLWQGSEDLMVPAHHAATLAELIPQATLHLEEGEGHLSISVGFLGRALDEALAHA